MLAKKAQSINEYAMIIAVVTLAAVTMQSYVKRGIQGVIKLTADDLVTGWQLTTAPATPVVPADGTIPESKNHATAKAYKERIGGFVEGVRSGNKIYYYHFTSDPDDKRTIGVEDTLTRDFTGFDIDGFASGVTNESNTPYLNLIFIRNEDAETHEVTSVTVQREIRDPIIPYSYLYLDLGTYGKYEMVKLSSSAAGEAAAQQKGIEELGLYDYTQPTGPLKVTSTKTSTVKESALSKVTLAPENWNPYAVAYQRNYGGFIDTEIEGNNVKYYHFSSDADQKELIAIEDALTRDLTTFDEDGFAELVWNENSTLYTDLKLTYHYDPVETKKVISVTVERKIGETYVTVGTYGKYQPVIISQVAATNSLPGITTKATGNNETTRVSGSWEATYKLGAETFGALEKRTPGDVTPPQPPGG